VREVSTLNVSAGDGAQPDVPAGKVSVLESLRSIHPAYRWLIASRFVFLLGIYDIQVFAQYYIRDVIKAPNPVALTGNLLAAITLALIAFALAGGWLGDRFGHKRVLYFASGIGSLGCLLLLAARTPERLLLFGAVLGVGIGLFLTSNWALANTHAPVGSAGRYLGMTNLATAGAGAMGRLGGPLIDLLNNASPGAFNGYLAMFVFGAICAILSVVLLRRVR
jgi:MFS family permease